MLKRVQIIMSACLLMFAFTAQGASVQVRAYKENKAQKKANKACSKKMGHGSPGANSVKCTKKCKRRQRGYWTATCKEGNTNAQNNPGGSCVYGSKAWKIKGLTQQRAQQKANNRCRRANSASAQTVQCISNCDKGALKRKEYCYVCAGSGNGSGSGTTNVTPDTVIPGPGAKSCKAGEISIKARRSKAAERKAKRKCKKAKKAFSSVYSIGKKQYCGVCEAAAACKSGEISFKSGKRSAEREAKRKCRKKQKKGLSSVYNIGKRKYCAVCDGGTTYKSGNAKQLCTKKGFFGGQYAKHNKKKKVIRKAGKTCQKANLNGVLTNSIKSFSSIKNRKKQVLWCYNCSGADEGGVGAGAESAGKNGGKVNVREATKACKAQGYFGGAVARKVGAAQREANRVCLKAGGSSKDDTCIRNCNQKNKKKIFCFNCSGASKSYATAKCRGRYSLKQVGGKWTCKHKKKNKTKTPKCKRRYGFNASASSAGQTCVK